MEPNRCMSPIRADLSSSVHETVHAAFEAQVDRAPGAVAVRSAGHAMSYGELEAHANRVAHVLRSRGVGPGMAVGVCLARSRETIVAVLGILKAGATYVPLEPAYPADRLRFMLQVTATALVIADSEHVARIPAGDWSALVLDGPEARAEVAAAPIARLDVVAGPGTRAYVMFTSGSTGQPKGVAIPHRGILRLVCDAEYVELGPTHTVLHVAPLAFDASTFEIFGPLLTGGVCALYTEGVPTPEGLERAIATNGVTTMLFTTGLFNAVIDAMPEALRGVRQVLMGGEALSVQHIRRAQAVLPETQFINAYGPTEATTFAACYAIPTPVPAVWQSIPIGYAITATTLQVLDDAGNAVRAGEPGELYIGGAGVALGYVGRADLTAERFVRDDASTDPDARLYRTGDLVRALPDGALDFVGRVDDQVKISGYRIEPQEVVVALRRDPRVRDAAVVARAVADGLPKRLVAYLVAERDVEPDIAAMDTSAVRETLRSFGARVSRPGGVRVGACATPDA